MKKEIENNIWGNPEINTIGKVEAQNAIDLMYEEFESRICENCKYWEQENSAQEKRNVGMCKSYQDADEYYTIGITSNNFGCNKFKRK